MTGKPTDSLALRALLVLVVGLGFAIPIARAEARSTTTLERRIAAAEVQAERLNARIGGSLVALAEARQRARGSASQEAHLAALLDAGRERAAALAEAVARSRSELDEATARLRRSQAALASRLVAIYKSGEPNAVNILLEANGFDDLATRADLLGRIQDADLGLAQRVAELRDAVADELAVAAATKRKAEAHVERVAVARDQIAGARIAAEADAAALAEARRDQSGELAALESNVGIWRRQAARRAQASTVPAASSAGGLQFGAWAIPEAIVMCESGGNFSALNPSSGAGGAYQILPSTWAAYGGKGLPHRGSPAEQHRIAAMIWSDSGPSAWVCAG